jgi:predicted metalloprotease with PDZ domain
VDYAKLLDRAGFTLRRRSPGEGFAGDFRLQDVQGRARVTSAVPFGSPAYAAGLDRDDFILSIGGSTVRTASEVDRMIRTAKPGQTLPVMFERRGQPVMSSLAVAEDPHVEIVPSENAGKTVTEEQKRFRQGWLSSPSRNIF